MKALEKKLGYTFRDSALLETALSHSSYANEHRASGAVSNERLEFLGDSVLGLVTAERLYSCFPYMPEGRMTRLRAELVCEQSLLQVANDLGIGEYIHLGKGEEHTGGRKRTSILADCVEAIIAAMYLDGGMDVAREFIDRFILRQLSDMDLSAPTDSKTALQELVQSRSGQCLSYELLGADGPDHCKTFTVQVSLNGRSIGRGEGSSKKDAEQAAARAALKELKS